MTLDNILEEINNANSIIILTHENPDGDAMGSALSMYLALKAYGKNADIIIPEFPKTYNFLPGIQEIKKESSIEQYDLAISLDCADIKRLNGFSKYFENAKSKISIDHHEANTMFADYNYVNPAAPSCSQILITLLEYLKIDITKEIGTCILTGIITDTGGFRFPSVTAETFEFTAWLLNKGINVSEIYKRTMETKTKSSFELNKLAYNRLEFLEDGKIACTYITKQDIEDTKAEMGDSEGIVNIGREVEGVEVSLFLRQIDDEIKISLRSNSYVNVSDIALIFGGGGHQRAAGCTINGSLEQAKQKIINEVKLHI